MYAHDITILGTQAASILTLFYFGLSFVTLPFCHSLEDTILAAELGKELCTGHHKRQ